MKNKFLRGMIFIGIIFFCLNGCTKEMDDNEMTVEEIIANAMNEEKLDSLAMPDDWANWKDTWQDLNILYQINHKDTDMSSVEELENFNKGIGDIGDVGFEYGREAKNKKLTLAYKTSYWDEIPEWAKDKDGDWLVCYTGTLSFLINTEIVKIIPTSWNDLLKADYKVGISDVENATLGQYSVYAAALAMGGDKNNLKPGIEFFKTLAKDNRLVHNLQSFEDYMESGVGVMVKWDFQALSYRDKALIQTEPVTLTACIPSDASVTVGYASIINRLAKHPYAAMLAREYILSDSGQINLAKGYATPIRSVKLPDELESKRIPKEQYTDAMVDYALEFDDSMANEISKTWTNEIMPILNKE